MSLVQNQGNQQQIQTIQPQVIGQNNQPKPVQTQYMQSPIQQAIPQQPQQGLQPMPVVAPPPAPNAPPPSYAGVNIQIYNPSVGIPNINPTGNAPVSQGMPGMAYPSNYYTQQFAPQQQPIPQVINQGGQGGNAVVNNNINSDKDSTPKAVVPQENKVPEKVEEKKVEEPKKKTEKRKVVELTDEYIKNLENYLNSPDKEIRMMGAKEVIARLQEDDSRKTDPALTALINKMLQDPAEQIKVLALGMLDSRTCAGDDYTIGILKNMQNSTTGYGQDAAQATNILLKMSGKVIEKEFEVPEKTEAKK